MVIVGATGTSSGRRLIRLDGSSGTVNAPVPLSARLALTSTDGIGNAWATVTYTATLTAPADDYQFDYAAGSNPAKTTPYAQHAADQQKLLTDGTGYYVEGRVYTNKTAAHALTQLQKTALFYVFGHGGSNANESYQTFWDGTNWHYMVQGVGGKNILLGRGVPADRIVCLDDQAGLPFAKVLLAVFEGCFTARSVSPWGSPADGAVVKGAACALGFTATIYSHSYNLDGSLVKGAEEWADKFWVQLAAGDSVFAAATAAKSGIIQSKNLYLFRIVGNGMLSIAPARYGP